MQLAERYAAGEHAEALKGASPGVIAALDEAASIIRLSQQNRHITLIKIAVALAVLDGVKVRMTRKRVVYKKCKFCGEEAGKRCRQPNGMPCKPHAGRETL